MRGICSTARVPDGPLWNSIVPLQIVAHQGVDDFQPQLRGRRALRKSHPVVLHFHQRPLRRAAQAESARGLRSGRRRRARARFAAVR